MRTSKETQPYSDLSISIQFSFSRVFSSVETCTDEMRQFVLRFVPEQLSTKMKFHHRISLNGACRT